MSSTNITVKYNTLSANVLSHYWLVPIGLCAILLTVVLQSQWLAVVAASLLGLSLPAEALAHLQDVLTWSAIAMIWCMPTLSNRAKQSTITLTPETIQLRSVSFGLRSYLRPIKRWGNLVGAQLQGRTAQSLGKLLLMFESPIGNISIELDKIESSKLESFLLAIQQRVNDKSPSAALALDELMEQLETDRIGGGEADYRRIWENSMNRRFLSVAFVPLEPGMTLQDGDITIDRHLAFGGLSAVYLAQKQNGVKVVIKEAAIPTSANAHSRERAEEMLGREAGFLMKLSHPQLVKIFDYFIENSRHYLALEYIPGESLRQYVARSGAVSEKQTIDWAKQMAMILAYLHNQNPPVVHRDFSPDNIICKPDGTLTVIDFGAAHEFLSMATGTIVGKQSYMPPEQFQGKSVPASDAYALGATMYFLLTATDPEPLSQLHPKEIKSNVSDRMNAFVNCLTEPNLVDRMSDADIIYRGLCDLDESVPPQDSQAHKGTEHG